jgi:hypothetical protein
MTSMCPEIMANRRQPMAGFPDYEGLPAFYCPKCFAQRIEDSLRAGEPIVEIAVNINFDRCGHVEEGTGTCGRCAKGILGYLVYLSTTLHLRLPRKDSMLGNLDELITRLTGLHGRISPHGIYTAKHGRAI